MKKLKYLLSICLLCSALLSFGQDSYRGTISDASSGDPLIGVSIVIQGSSVGTITDIDGSFEISAKSGATAVVTYVGYKSVELTLGPDRNLEILMEESSEVLDEVVVIGYGTIRKSDLTGSVASIKSEDITSLPTNNAMQALQGKVAGLSILNTSGDPGAAPVVRLRGVTTLNDNNPIAVIDGVISEVEDIGLLNPSDIESMEVLKDASATAIYGSRGAAGVIMVTTKRGKLGENRITASVERGIESVANYVDVMDGAEFATYLNQINPGTYNNLDALPNTDWQSLVYTENAAITNANFSVSGASETNNFYFGLGYFGQEGIIPKSGLDRLTGKLNVGFDLSDHLDIGLDLSVALTDKDNAPGVVNTALRAWPIREPFLEDGTTFADVEGGNPLAAINFTNSNTKTLQAIGNLYTNIKFLNHFTFKPSLQFNVREGKTRSFNPVFFVGPLQQNEVNDLTYGIGTSSTILFENTLTYDQQIGKHGFNALLGYTSQDERGENLTGFTEGLIREDPLFWYLNAGQNDLDQVSNGFERNTLLSYLARANYTYDSRYLATASWRRDGSSKFGPNNKYGNFYSVALGWNISNEQFFPEDGPINRMKFRTSYGTIGNESIPGSAQYNLISTGADAVFGPDESIEPGATFNGGGNPDLKWESTAQFNIGLDLGIFEDRLTIELDYYDKQTSDILVPLRPIGYTGIGAFRTIIFNAADVNNTGLEWNVNYRNSIGKFNYAVGVNGSTISNEVTNIGQGFGADSLLVGGNLGNGQDVARSAVGFPIGFFYGYEVEGIWQNADEIANNASLAGQAAGDFRYRDLNNDGAINGDDRTMIGNSIPSLIYGFNAELGYGNFSVAANFQGQSGNDIYNGKQPIRFTTLNYEDRFNQYWTGPGSTNEDPKPSEGGNNFLPSSYFVEDGSFLRLRTLTLNYDFGSSLLRKIKMDRVSVYVRGTNLFTATSFTGYSPEIGAASAIDGVIDRGVYPITRVFSAGVNANF